MIIYLLSLFCYYLRLDRDMHPKIYKDAPGMVEIGQMILNKIFSKIHDFTLYTPP